MIPPDSAVIERLRFSSCPVMFRTGVEETPLSIAGTAFVVGYGRHIYLVTAAHVTRGEPIFDSLLVLPSGTAKEPLRFTR
jgi:hypothetical protein